MIRDVVHPKFPYTEDEIAAAWILVGKVADEARPMAQGLNQDLASLFSAEEDEPQEGWSAEPMIGFFEGFTPVLMLASDIHAGGTLLSEEARRSVQDSWTLRFSAAEADAVLDQLDLLGATWAQHRTAFRELLIRSRE